MIWQVSHIDYFFDFSCVTSQKSSKLYFLLNENRNFDSKFLSKKKKDLKMYSYSNRFALIHIKKI